MTCNTLTQLCNIAQIDKANILIVLLIHLYSSEIKI